MSKIIRCNKCGRILDEWDIQAGFSTEKRIGYGSRYDGCVVEIDLCCSCMDEQIDKLINECEVSPIIYPE